MFASRILSRLTRNLLAGKFDILGLFGWSVVVN